MVECSSNVVRSISKRNHKTNDINRCHNTSYLVQFHNAGAKKESVPSNNYFSKIEKFITEHYEEGENYREFLKFSCGEKVGANCSFCKEWTGPLIDRCPKPFPDHSCLPEYHYLPYNNTPREGRNPDDWQPRVQLKKERGSGRLVLSDSESVAAFSDKFIVKPKFVVEHLKHLEVVDFKKKKRAEERAKESQKAKEKNHEDYAWKDLCEDPTKLQKLRVPELNKYLKHHRLDKHLKSTKHDKVKVIARHWLLQMNPERTDLLQTRLREKDSAENESLLDIDNDDSDEDDNSGSESSSERDESNDVILAFIDDDEEVAFIDDEEVERPATTRSGRAITRRSEIDFSFFFLTLQRIQSL